MYDRLLEQPPPGLAVDEIIAHFQAMPPRYWERVTEEGLLWGLNVIHKFLQNVSTPSAIAPVLDWKQYPERGFTKVMLCTWDRLGLLSKVASAFSAVRVNILSAEAYTRADNIILDVFRVCDENGQAVANPDRFQQTLFLLEGSLSEPPRFASIWANSRHKIEKRKAPAVLDISFDNRTLKEHTILFIETNDRLGLLSDILEALTLCNLNVAQAIIETDQTLARDSFYLTGSDHKKIEDESALKKIETSVALAIRG
ncbi:MAG TPA: hypothetical protein VGE41_00160 [Verrucomicrobiae bacterium]|jgi:[protein-PII] uridylyltransferase